MSDPERSAKMKSITLFLSLALVANAAPSKEAESDSLIVAHRELQRITGLDMKAQYDYFTCELWFYESIDDAANLGRLKDQEKEEMKRLVGNLPFFLHRYTSKTKRSEVFEVVIGNDGKTVISIKKKEPNQRLQTMRFELP